MALGLVAIACLPFGKLRLDWTRSAVMNPKYGVIGCSLLDVPTMQLPLVTRPGRDGRSVCAVVAHLRAADMSRAASFRAWLHHGRLIRA